MKIEKYYRAKEELGLRLEYCGIEYCEPDFSMPAHRRDVFLIHIVLQGEGEFRCRDVLYPLGEGSLFAIFPQEFVSYQGSAQKPPSLCWFGFSGANAARIMARIGLSVHNPVCALSSTQEVELLISECINFCDSKLAGAELRLQSVLYRLFAAIEERQGGKNEAGHNAGSVAYDHVQRAKSYIRFNYMNPLSIGDVAKQANLERTYFSKIFHQFEHTTPQEYLLLYRLESARQLLKNSEYSVREVGSLVGIHDPYYFSRVFKKYTGASPLQYRRGPGEETQGTPAEE